MVGLSPLVLLQLAQRREDTGGMKRRVLIALALVVMLGATPGQAVAQEFGLRVGAMAANVNITEPSKLPAELRWCCSPWDGERIGWTAGLYGSTRISNDALATIEVLLTRRGYNVDASTLAPGSELTMTYLEAPVLFAAMARSVRVFGGASAGVTISKATLSKDPTRPDTFVDREQISDLDVSLIVGAGVRKNRWSIDGRYTHGLRNVLRGMPEGASLRHKALSVYVGFQLGGKTVVPTLPVIGPRRRR